MDLIAVAGLEQIEDVGDEVVDLDCGIVDELWLPDRRVGVVVGVHRHSGVPW